MGAVEETERLCGQLSSLPSQGRTSGTLGRGM